MSIFEYLDYRKLISFKIKTNKEKFYSFSQRKAALESGIQPSYLSNALKEKANLNGDQLYALGKALKLNEQELQYLLLLGDYNHSTSKERKEKLLEQIEALQKKHLKSQSHLDVKVHSKSDFLQEYYSDPYIKIIHVCFHIPKYQKNTKNLAEDLELNLERVEQIIEMLEKYNLIKHTSEKTELVQSGFHLPEDHPFVWAHQSLIRQQSIGQLQKTKKENKYSFSATFSTSPEVFLETKKSILKCISEIQKKVTPSKSQKTYQLNIDLFPWLK